MCPEYPLAACGYKSGYEAAFLPAHSEDCVNRLAVAMIKAVVTSGEIGRPCSSVVRKLISCQQLRSQIADSHINTPEPELLNGSAAGRSPCGNQDAIQVRGSER